MIYLIITTSINNKYGNNNYEERKNRYIYSINESLRILPEQIIPIIVENNGKRDTYLDNFYHNNKQVSVCYTDNNRLLFKSKGINEVLDIKEVIERYNIQDDDMIIKLTGRYRVLSPLFFNEVLKNKDMYEAFVKFFGTCSLKFEKYDCILGCYAIKAKYIKLFNHFSIDNYPSAEIAFAKYVKFCGLELNEINQLDIECSFGEDNRILCV
jgi:hypothetical protein